jgi:hypothetical protein
MELAPPMVAVIAVSKNRFGAGWHGAMTLETRSSLPSNGHAGGIARANVAHQQTVDNLAARRVGSRNGDKAHIMDTEIALGAT